MRNLWFCCFKEDDSSSEQKSTNLESELSVVDKLNIVKEIMRKSVEQAKSNRTVPRKRPEIILGIEKIPVYEISKGQFRVKNESIEMIYTD